LICKSDLQHNDGTTNTLQQQKTTDLNLVTNISALEINILHLFII